MTDRARRVRRQGLAVASTAGFALVAWVCACGGGQTSNDVSETADASVPGGEITWHQHVAPLVAERCAGCHQDGGIAPFALDTYERAEPWSALMLQSVMDGTMPPFLPEDTETCVPRHVFRNDPALSDAEKQLLARWVAAGSPEGERSAAAPVPAPAELALDRVDLSLSIPSAVDVEGEDDVFVCFVLDPELGEDLWFDASQVIPGNAEIVHHVILFEDVGDSLDAALVEAGTYDCFGSVRAPGAQFRAGWAPGALPNRLPEGAAARIGAGNRLILQVHYHPSDEPERDEATTVQLRRFEGTPALVADTLLVGNLGRPSTLGLLLAGADDEAAPEFRIPAGATDHVETLIFRMFPDQPAGRIWLAGTHMHYIGKGMQVHLRRPAPSGEAPEQECLIDTPRWDFGWQQTYAYDAPYDALPALRAGDEIVMRCSYDNSLGNPAVREALRERGLDAPVDVLLGQGSLEEMCVAILGVLRPNEGEAP